MSAPKIGEPTDGSETAITKAMNDYARKGLLKTESGKDQTTVKSFLSAVQAILVPETHCSLKDTEKENKWEVP